MNIILFTVDLPPFNFGGMATYVSHLVESLKNQDDIRLYVVYYLKRMSEAPYVEQKEKNVYLLHFPLLGKVKTNEDLQEYSNGLVDFVWDKVGDAVKEECIIHLNGWPSVFILRALKDKGEFPVVFTQHSFEWQFPLNGNIKRLEEFKSDERYRVSLERMNFESELALSSDKVIAVSESIKSLLIETVGVKEDSIARIYNGIDISRFIQNKEIDKNALKNKLGFDSNEKLVLFLGRLYSQKGIEYLIKAFRIVLKERSDVKLLIVGHGDLDRYLRQCENIWSKVVFTSFVVYDKVIEILKIADVGVVPSIWEPFGYTAIEIMASGLPLIASDIEGLSEIVTDGVDGYKVKVVEDEEGNRRVDEEELASKILYVLDNPDEAKQVGKEGQKTVQNRFTSEKMAKETYKVYKQVLRDKKS